MGTIQVSGLNESMSVLWGLQLKHRHGSDHACHCQGGPLHTLRAASLNHVRMKSNTASGQMAALTQIYKITTIIHTTKQSSRMETSRTGQGLQLNLNSLFC